MTIQQPDRLIYRNEEHYIPGGGPLLSAWSERDAPEFEAFSSACWRGFAATWLIEDGWLKVASVLTGPLHLEDIGNGRKQICYTEALQILFPNQGPPITARWFTGEIVAGYGQDIERPLPYLVLYPHYRVFRVEGGKVRGVADQTAEWWLAKYPDLCDLP